MSIERPAGLRVTLRDWLRPPRPHGEAVEDRVVSSLELFYDLVFVVFVAQVAQALAARPDVVGLGTFIVLFSLVWYTWLNGTLYHDLHGGDDGRSRVYMFVQMSLIALISVYAGHAGDRADDGRSFATVLLVLIAWLTYQWWVVRRQDDPAMAATTTPYFIGLAGIFLFVLASIFAASDAVRVLLWGLGAVAAIIVPLVALSRRRDRIETAFQISASMAERFGLFTIIVLGEVMAGVVNGLHGAEHSASTTAVGLLCLGIGFGIWWNYFDFVGLRPPRPGLAVRGLWLITHLPLSMAVAAIGAGMVGLIEQAPRQHSPAGTAWLIGGSVAVLCLCLAVLLRLLPERRGAQLVPVGLIVAAVVAVAAAALQPAPWVLTLVLVLALTAVWGESFVRHARLGEPFSTHP
ncbi:MAG: low temperature requirement protein A [Kineosporiaceae bacterium]